MISGVLIRPASASKFLNLNIYLARVLYFGSAFSCADLFRLPRVHIKRNLRKQEKLYYNYIVIGCSFNSTVVNDVYYPRNSVNNTTTIKIIILYIKLSDGKLKYHLRCLGVSLYDIYFERF